MDDRDSTWQRSTFLGPNGLGTSAARLRPPVKKPHLAKPMLPSGTPTDIEAKGNGDGLGTAASHPLWSPVDHQEVYTAAAIGNSAINDFVVRLTRGLGPWAPNNQTQLLGHDLVYHEPFSEATSETLRVGEWGAICLDQCTCEQCFGYESWCDPTIVNPEVDAAAMHAGVRLMNLLVSKQITGLDNYYSALEGWSALVDTVTEHELDVDMTQARMLGKTYSELIDGLCDHHASYYCELLQSASLMQLHACQLKYSAVPQSLEMIRDRCSRSFGDYIAWRVAEGGFEFLLYLGAHKYNVDIRRYREFVHQVVLPGGIIAWDIHAHYRHAAEGEALDLMHLVSGEGWACCVEDALRFMDDAISRITHEPGIDPASRALFARYVMLTLTNYLGLRWRTSTPLHVDVSGGITDWSHTWLGRTKR